MTLGGAYVAAAGDPEFLADVREGFDKKVPPLPAPGTVIVLSTGIFAVMGHSADGESVILGSVRAGFTVSRQRLAELLREEGAES